MQNLKKAEIPLVELLPLGCPAASTMKRESQTLAFPRIAEEYELRSPNIDVWRVETNGDKSMFQVIHLPWIFCPERWMMMMIWEVVFVTLHQALMSKPGWATEEPTSGARRTSAGKERSHPMSQQ